MPDKKIKAGSSHSKNPGLSHVPLLNWIAFWALVMLTMAFIVITLGRAYRSTMVAPDSNKNVTPVVVVDANVIKQLHDLEKVSQCMLASLSWDASAPNETVNYTDPQTHVSMALPYNKNWGDGKTVLPPYTTVQNEIHFGPAVQDGGCVLSRDSILQINALDPASVNNVRLGLEAMQNNKLTNLKEQTVAGLQVLSFNFNLGTGLGIEKTWLAFGKTQNYTLHSGGWLTDEEAIKIIQSLKAGQ
jgi:hypothetical protein